MVHIIELNARQPNPDGATVFDLLSKQDAIVVLRDVPEIQQIRTTICALTAQRYGTTRLKEVDAIFRTGRLPNLEAFAAIHRALIHLRNSRFLSCLFVDLVRQLGLPEPILIDCGFSRMVAPRHVYQAQARSDLFAPDEPATGDPNEAEGALQGVFWGDAHRDITVFHYHYQLNFWFPLHPLEERNSLVLFPERYRQDVPMRRNVGDPTDADTWGYGKARQIPLQFGDMLVFHSQQLHASPYLGPDRDRLTVEIRVAANCLDDNAVIYRRLFWNAENFRPAAGDGASLQERAEQLAGAPADMLDLDRILAGRTAHAVYHRLFRSAVAGLRAGYLHRDVKDLDSAFSLDGASWAKIVARLATLPTGEDLWLAVARILIRQEQRDEAAGALSRVIKRTKSFFWALEAGRIAAEAELYELAATAFRVAEFRARSAQLTLSPVVPGAGGAPDHLLQLTPQIAGRAAAAFAARAESPQFARTTPTFDHRLFWPPQVAASFDHYDILFTSGLYVALPTTRLFNPEQILSDPTGIVIAERTADIAAVLVNPLGNKLPEPRPLVTDRASFDGHTVVRYLNGWYIIPDAALPIDFVNQDVTRLPGVVTLGPGESSDALNAAAKIASGQNSRETDGQRRAGG
ncbi:MAG TPA: hypothetical protein VMH36_11285 [Alphaproteobacteria bacterium]|nr:hypothetical protein [Alphaproteobacteria bacterium]